MLGAAQFDGRPSAVLRARLDHAAALYRRKIAPMVVVTGGKAEGDRFTESAASANYLHTKGVPDEAILREATGRTSWQSLAASARFLQESGIHDVVLVSDPFHAARIAGIASELGFDAATSPTRTSPITGLSEFRHMVTETAQVGIGPGDRLPPPRPARGALRGVRRERPGRRLALSSEAPVRGW